MEGDPLCHGQPVIRGVLFKQPFLVRIEGLLPAVFQIFAQVLLGKTMLNEC